MLNRENARCDARFGFTKLASRKLDADPQHSHLQPQALPDCSLLTHVNVMQRVSRPTSTARRGIMPHFDPSSIDGLSSAANDYCG
jgi:hypothetical protein